MLEMEHGRDRMAEMDERRLAVVSALGNYAAAKYDGVHEEKITDQLIQYHQSGHEQLLDEIIDRHRFEADRLGIFESDEDLEGLMSEFRGDLLTARASGNSAETEIQGEIMAAKLFAEYSGATHLDPRQVIHMQDPSANGEQKVDLQKTSNALREAMDDRTRKYVLGGYGGTYMGETRLLGRSGTDVVAAAAAVALGTTVYENFKEKDGVYTADPEKIESTKRISKMTYDEARDYGNAGAAVLHRRVVGYLWDKNDPSVDRDIETHIKQFDDPNSQGTIIRAKRDSEPGETVIGLAERDDFLYVKLHDYGMNERSGYIRDLADWVARYGEELPSDGELTRLTTPWLRSDNRDDHRKAYALYAAVAEKDHDFVRQYFPDLSTSLHLSSEHMPTNTDSIGLIMRKDQFIGPWNEDEEANGRPHILQFIESLQSDFNDRVESFDEISSLHLIGQQHADPITQARIFAKLYGALADAEIGTNGADVQVDASASVVFLNGDSKRHKALGVVHDAFFTDHEEDVTV